MKKYTFYFICFLMAVAVTSCKKEKEEDSFLKGQMTDFHGQKAYIDGSNYSCFRQGETIFVNVRNNCTVSALSNSDRTCTISGAEEASGYYAFYPANMISATDISSGFSGATVTLPRVQQYVEESGHQVIDNPMAGHLNTSSGTIQFYNLCALLKVTVQSNWVQLDSIQMILKGTTLWGTGTVNASDWKLEMTNGQANHDTISLDFTGTNHAGNYTGEAFYIMVPEVEIADDPTMAEVQIRIFGKRAPSTDATPRSYSISLSAARTVTHNNIQLFNKVYADTVIGVGEFTVEPAQNGRPARKVSFASGNLLHEEITNGKWRFPNRPYHGVSGSSFKYYFSYNNHTLVGTDAESDWGWKHEIQYRNDYQPLGITELTSPPHTWRIPTRAEWINIIMGARGNNGSGEKNFVYQKVNDTYGLIFFPDNFDFSKINGVVIDRSLPSGNPIGSDKAEENWYNYYEKNGCIFLPAHGYTSSTHPAYNDGSNVTYHGSYGYYASANSNTPDVGHYSCFKFQNNAKFNGDNITPNGISCNEAINGKGGVNVRLVHDLN